MSELRVGVIGTGMMGCEHLRNLMGIPEAVVTAISDPHDEQHGWARRTLGDNAASVREFTDHRDLLNSGLVDAVLVASPNFTHKVLLDDIFDTDIPVLVEKPMCTTVEDCVSIVNAQCNYCHGAAANSIGGGIYLNTYAAMQPYIKNGSFLNSILQNGKASAMPKNGAKMDNCSILKIQSWINKGAINN